LCGEIKEEFAIVKIVRSNVGRFLCNIWCR